MVRSLALGTLAVVLLGCAGGGGEPEELAAVPYPSTAAEHVAGETAEVPDATATDTDATATTGAADRQGGEPEAATGADPPDTGEALAFIEAHRPTQLLADDHLLMDLDDDGRLEVLLAVLTADRRATVTVGRWAGDGYERADRVDVGPADLLGVLRGAQLHGSPAVVLPLRTTGGDRVAVWEVGDDRLRAPAECPIEDEGRLRSVTGRWRTVSCAETGRARDDALVWRDSAFVAGGADGADGEAVPDELSVPTGG